MEIDELANDFSVASNPVKAEENTSENCDIQVNIEQTIYLYANLLSSIVDTIH